MIKNYKIWALMSIGYLKEKFGIKK
jgi:hypothetical protein